MLYYKVWKRITEEPHERDADIIFFKTAWGSPQSQDKEPKEVTIIEIDGVFGKIFRMYKTS
jgi:hypothetical protein